MENQFKIASWNLCLGLSNKKDIVFQMILNEKIYVCCLQEIEILPEVDHGVLA